MFWLICSVISVLLWIYVIIYIKSKYSYSIKELIPVKLKFGMFLLFSLISLIPICGLIGIIIFFIVLQQNDYYNNKGDYWHGDRIYRHENKRKNYDRNFLINFWTSGEECPFIYKSYKENYPFKFWNDLKNMFIKILQFGV